MSSDDKKKPLVEGKKKNTRLIEDTKKNSFQPQVQPGTKLTIPAVNPKTIPKKNSAK